MQFADQHISAIRPTVHVRNEVSASVFDDKVKDMGTVTVAAGKISIDLDYVPGMITSADTGAFLIDAIGLSLRACWGARPEAFERP